MLSIDEIKRTYEGMERKKDKISFLQALLSISDSPYGDWKVIKNLEAKNAFKDIPYDQEELSYNRQLIRDEINRLQEMPVDEEQEGVKL